jgi:hypothetical protein
LDFLEQLPEQHGLYKGGFPLFALLCLPKASINGDDTIWSWHLKLIVDVAWPGMETMEDGTTKDDVVRTFKGNHLKGYGLFTEIIFITEGNLEGDGP